MLPELKTFMTIVEVNNIDKVIENLNISKATIYEHIKYLEQYFSSNIARISEKNEIAITESGSLLYKRAKQIFNIIDDTSIELIQNNDSIQGNIKLGVNFTLEEYVLPKFLSYFLKKYPNINVEIFSDHNQNICDRLHGNEFDIGLIEEIPSCRVFKQTKFLRDKMVLIIPYANTIKDISSYINEFKFKRWITRESSCSTRKFIELFLKENNINPEDIMMLGSNYAIKEAVKNNLGISIISKFVAEPAYKNDEICILPLDDSYERYFSYILNNEDISECSEIFLNELRSFCKHFYK